MRKCWPRSRARIAGGYRCVTADRRARLLTHKPRRLRKLVPGNPLWIIVVDHLRQGLSPAQIASTLARMPDPVRLSYETIYTALYTMPRGHLRSSLLVLMRRQHRAKRPHRGKVGRSKPSIPGMTLIDQRPIEVQMRLIPGHWEGDLMIGKGNLSQVGTLVERTTLFVALVKLDSSKADVTAEAFTKILNRFDSQMRRSMTYDQGSEMRHHKTLEQSHSSCIPVSAETEPSRGVVWSDGFESLGDGMVQGFGGTRLGRAQELFELGPGFFDGVQVR
jgi:IS30 family transposase